MNAALTRSWRAIDRDLGRFDPLPRIMSVDKFSEGQHGWAAYFPDYDGWDDYDGKYPHVESLSRIRARTDAKTIDNRVDRRFPTGPRCIPQLSGTSLKISTHPTRGSQAVAKKRLGSPWNARFRIEAYWGCSVSPGAESSASSAIRSVSLSHDVHDPWRVDEETGTSRRWWPGVKFLNAEDGHPVQRWQIMRSGSWGTMDGPWDDLPDGLQPLRLGSASVLSPDGVGWHYLRLTFDLRRHEYVDFNCDGREFDVAGIRHVFDPPLVGWRASTDKAHGLILPTFGVEAADDVRCNLYLDTIVVSASEE